jgi:hypothetical protein
MLTLTVCEEARGFFDEVLEATFNIIEFRYHYHYYTGMEAGITPSDDLEQFPPKISPYATG